MLGGRYSSVLLGIFFFFFVKSRDVIHIVPLYPGTSCKTHVARLCICMPMTGENCAPSIYSN